MSNKNFIPYQFYWDDAPLDLSFVYKNEKPAGKHGFLKAKGDKMVFEDGKEARFWGTNVNSAVNFPEFEQSEKIAKRLAKFGINMVRFHQLDSEWSTPNIFQFSKGERLKNTMELDPESMKRLDYFIACLKKNGIYMYLDMMTYRRFLSGDGVENAHLLPDSAKPYSIFDERMIELQKKFCNDIWNHYNPYTELAYKDDPSIVLTEITNECDFFYLIRHKVEVEPYRTRLEEKYRVWADNKGITVGGDKIDFTQPDDTILTFFCEVQEQYFNDMRDYMQSIGVKIPITGTNWPINAANRISHRSMDFQDAHQYWYKWCWGVDDKKFGNNSMLKDKAAMVTELAYSRELGKPFFVSEWDAPWPNEWRAESPLYLAAVGALNGWSGYTIHTYRYSNYEGIDIVGKEICSSSIGKVPYREGVFATFNDPAKFGLFYHAALMFIRGDIKEANKTVCIEVDGLRTESEDVLSLQNSITEVHKVGMKFCNENLDGDENIHYKDEFGDSKSCEILSDTGEIYRNTEKGIGWINTDKSKAVYGFWGQEEAAHLGSVTIDMKTDFATIAVSSLTDDVIQDSDNIFITAVGRSENTDMVFNNSHTEMIDIGKAPILIEAIEAEIVIKDAVEGMRVISIDAQGFVVGEIPSEYKDGCLAFEIGKQFPSMYYLIQKL